MYDLCFSKAVIYNYTNCFVSLKAMGHGNTDAFGLANKPYFGTKSSKFSSLLQTAHQY